MPGLGLSGAKSPSSRGRTVPAFVMAAGLGLAPHHWLGSGARGHPGGGRTPECDPWGDLKRRIRAEGKQPEKRRKRRKRKRKRKLSGFSRLQLRFGVSYPCPLAFHTEIQDSCLPSRAKQSRVPFLIEIWGQEMWVGIFSL